MSTSLSSALTCRVQLYGRADKEKNELDETTYTYEPKKTLWAEIVPISATEQSTQGEESYIAYSHRITVRAPCALATDMYILYRGKRFNIVSWEAHYKARDRIVIKAREEIGRNGIYG